MTRKPKPPKRAAPNQIKDPDYWVTGDEPMTAAQESYLNTLATEAGEQVESDLSKAEASKRIDELQEETGRGRSGCPVVSTPTAALHRGT